MNTDKTPEQRARDLLERMDVPNAQAYTAGDLAELANLIARLDVLEAVTTHADSPQYATDADVRASAQRMIEKHRQSLQALGDD